MASDNRFGENRFEMNGDILIAVARPARLAITCKPGQETYDVNLEYLRNDIEPDEEASFAASIKDANTTF